MITAYILDNCHYSNEAEKLLNQYKIKSNIIRVPQDEKIKNELKKKHKMNTFPQIFINYNKTQKIPIGGYSELSNYIYVINSLKSQNINIDILYLLNNLM